MIASYYVLVCFLYLQYLRHASCWTYHSAYLPPSSTKSFHIADGTVIKANRLELSVWSDHFHRLLSSSHDGELKIADADPEVLGTLVRALYEKEVSGDPCITARSVNHEAAMLPGRHFQWASLLLHTCLHTHLNCAQIL